MKRKLFKAEIKKKKKKIKKDPPVPQFEKVLTRFSQVGAPLAASAFPFKNRPRLSA